MSESQEDINKKMKEHIEKKVKELMGNMSSGMMMALLMFVLLFFILLYIFLIVRKKDSNCVRIQSYPSQLMNPLSEEVKQTTLNKTYVKTAYNCCCTGDFKNDYVGTCALMNCCRQGVRALDFTIYSLHGEPVIAASTLASKRYKEMYNHLPFSKTMSQVKQMFLYDTVNCSNITDPLFLIFRIHSSNLNVYNKMGDILLSLFGDGNASGNKLYVPPAEQPLDTEIISNLIGKVVILVDITGVQGIENTKLYPITALPLGTMNNQVYRESDSYDLLESGINPNENYVNVLYPDYQPKSVNYDFNTVGLKQNFQFIGMNYQLKDIYLDAYNQLFTSSILIQPYSS